jgi:2-hydroxychromene-2-carboxylate isomerase
MRALNFYFDFVSPFSYLALHRLHELPRDLEIRYRPVLFAGLLNHWGQKGPAEMAPKRRYTYRWCHWRAQSLGIPFRFPAGHPFNPLHHLRLAIACDCRPEAVWKIFESIWTTGADAAGPERFASLLKDLGIDREALEKTKEELRTNTEAAVARGVFGVPTFEVDGELFWGADSIEFVRDFLGNAAVIHNPEMQRLDDLPVAAARRT